MKQGYVYILASERNGTLYTGVTSNIAARMMQHRASAGSKFAAKYKVQRLVYVETHNRIEDAIAREKAVKKWRRDWKLKTIEAMNPDWDDLFETINA